MNISHIANLLSTWNVDEHSGLCRRLFSHVLALSDLKILKPNQAAVSVWILAISVMLMPGFICGVVYYHLKTHQLSVNHPDRSPPSGYGKPGSKAQIPWKALASYFIQFEEWRQPPKRSRTIILKDHVKDLGYGMPWHDPSHFLMKSQLERVLNYPHFFWKTYYWYRG